MNSDKQSGTRRIGIAVDNYKVERYTEEINKLGYSVITRPGVTSKTKTLTIDVSEQIYDEAREKIRRMCKRLEHTKGHTNN